MDQFILLKFLGRLAMPPSSMVAGLLIAVVLALFGARRTAALVGSLAVLQLIALSSAPVADALIEPLQRQAREAAEAAPACCYNAIVVLGGGINQAAPPLMPFDDLTDAADRMRYAAQLFRQGLAPRIVVSGGDAQPDVAAGAETEADAMARFLIDLGVPKDAIVKESRSRNTGENMAFIRQMVGDRPVALVTSAFHMPRALQLAKRQGLNVFAFPTDFRTPLDTLVPWQRWLPSVESLTMAHYALWEYLGLIFDWRRFPAS
jgi:uncharacterized SAM-binding protein YcdF (DUF218 family)